MEWGIFRIQMQIIFYSFSWNKFHSLPTLHVLSCLLLLTLVNNLSNWNWVDMWRNGFSLNITVWTVPVRWCSCWQLKQKASRRALTRCQAQRGTRCRPLGIGVGVLRMCAHASACDCTLVYVHDCTPPCACDSPEWPVFQAAWVPEEVKM